VAERQVDVVVRSGDDQRGVVGVERDRRLVLLVLRERPGRAAIRAEHVRREGRRRRGERQGDRHHREQQTSAVHRGPPLKNSSLLSSPGAAASLQPPRSACGGSAGSFTTLYDSCGWAIAL